MLLSEEKINEIIFQVDIKFCANKPPTESKERMIVRAIEAAVQRPIADLMCQWKSGKISGDELAEKLFSLFASNPSSAVLEAQKGQEPVAWGLQIPGEIGFRQIWTVKDEPFNAALNRWPEAYKDAIQVPLYAAPVVQPDMVMVPREATEAMLDAAMNRYKHVSPEARLRFFQMHRENFRWDYRAMIAAAEGKRDERTDK